MFTRIFQEDQVETSDTGLTLDAAQEKLMERIMGGGGGGGASGQGEPRPKSETAPSKDADDNAEPEEAEGSEPEVAASEPAEGAQPEGEEYDAFENLTQVAEAAGVDLDAFLATVQHTVKQDGKEVTRPLNELISDGLRLEDYTRKTQAVAEERKKLDAMRKEREQSLETFHVALQAQFGQAVSFIDEQLKSPELENMRTTDPDLWTAKHYELTLAKNGIVERARADAVQFAQAQAQRFQQKQQDAADALRGAVPDWGPKHTEAVKAVFKEYGMTDEDMLAIAQLGDYRLPLMAYDLAKAREGSAKTETTPSEVKKKLKKLVPRMADPSKKEGTPAQKDAAAYARSRKRLQETGSVDDAAEAIRLKMGNRLR